MKRINLFGTSLLLLSTLIISNAQAETRVEYQLQLTHPRQVAVRTSEATSTPKNNTVTLTDAQIDQAAPVQEATPNLSERDRLILERQQQRVIPAAR